MHFQPGHVAQYNLNKSENLQTDIVIFIIVFIFHDNSKSTEISIKRRCQFKFPWYYNNCLLVTEYLTLKTMTGPCRN